MDNESVLNVPVCQLKATSEFRSPNLSLLTPILVPRASTHPGYSRSNILGTASKRNKAGKVHKHKPCRANKSTSTEDVIVMTPQQLKRLKQDNWCFVCQKSGMIICYCKERFYCSTVCEQKASSHVHTCKRKSFKDIKARNSFLPWLAVNFNFIIHTFHPVI